MKKAKHFAEPPADIADLVRNNNLPTNRSPSKSSKITPHLRVWVYVEGGKKKHKIQQGWEIDGTPGLVWKDLPVVVEGEN